MSAHSGLGDALRTPASTDPGPRKIVDDILRGWASDPTLAFLDAIPIHPTTRVIARATLRRWAADQRISVSRKVSREMQGDLSQTRHIELELSGELPSYLEGSTRRIPLPIDEIAAALRRLFPNGRGSRDTYDVLLDRLKKDGVVASLSTLKR